MVGTVPSVTVSTEMGESTAACRTKTRSIKFGTERRRNRGKQYSRRKRKTFRYEVELLKNCVSSLLSSRVTVVHVKMTAL